jgi:hypothetical protein
LDLKKYSGSKFTDNVKELEAISLERTTKYMVDDEHEEDEPHFLRREMSYLHIKTKIGPEVDILVGGKFGISAADLFLNHEPGTWAQLSASCTPECVAFVSDQPEYVKAAICALKKLRNILKKALKCKQGKVPGSFALELIVIWVASHTHATTAQESFAGALRLLSKPDEEICCVWPDCRSATAVSPGILDERPLVLDPIKPGNNVVRRKNLALIRQFAVEALALLGW